MRKFALIAIALISLSGCGYTQVDADEVGQVKGLTKTNNLICHDYYILHVSLGVMRNGTGSMSIQDVEYAVDPAVNIEELRAAVKNSSLIETKFNVRRGFSGWCTEWKELVSFTVVQ